MNSLDELRKNSKNNKLRDVTDESVNVHEGHRKRMKEKFINDLELKTFADHEVLELYLFNGIPRKDTNELAHRLIRHFGSFRNVFYAPIEELLSIKGMTENAAMMIKQTVSVYHRCKQVENVNAFLGTTAKLVNYYHDYFFDVDTECAYVSLLDYSNKLLGTIEVGRGDDSSVTIDTRQIAQYIRIKGASKIVIMHNHPDGDIRPSVADMNATCTLMAEAYLLGIELKDHIIFASDGRYFSFIEHDLYDALKNRCYSFLLGGGLNVPQNFKEITIDGDSNVSLIMNRFNDIDIKLREYVNSDGMLEKLCREFDDKRLDEE